MFNVLIWEVLASPTSMGQCSDALGASVDFLSNESVASFVFAVIGVVTAGGSVVYLRHQRNLAQSGSTDAGVRTLIFPIYFYVLQILTVIDIYHAVINVLYSQVFLACVSFFGGPLFVHF